MKDKNILKVYLLRHGIVSHGGARHETYFGENLHKSLTKNGIRNIYKVFLANRIYRGLQNIELLYWAWKHSTGDVNILVERLGLSALLRTRNSKKLNLLVLHNHDRHDGKKKHLSVYFNMLFGYIRKQKPKNLAIIVVAPYFQRYFRRLLPGIPIFMMPNLFDVSKYQPFIQHIRDKKKIHLGQFSYKNHPSVFELAKMLSQSGYYCYFSTLYDNEVGVFENYEAKKMDFDIYLYEMATSNCTIAFTGINEGWPRLNHESIMVGTPVIGYKNGGLGDLLRESNSYIVSSPKEAFDLITGEEELKIRASDAFLQRYDVTRTEEYLAPIVEYIREKQLV